METLRGRIARLMVYEEEGRGDLALSLAKLCLYASCFLFPPSVLQTLSFLFFVKVFSFMLPILLMNQDRHSLMNQDRHSWLR